MTRALLAVDATLIAANLALSALAKADLLIERVPDLWRLETESNLGAWWNMGQWAALIALCAWAARRGLGALPTALAAIFAMLLADDALELHERVGFALARRLEFGSLLNLQPYDLGELCAAAGEGVLLALALFWAWRRRGPGDARRLAAFVGLFALLGLVGVVLDALHSAVWSWRYAEYIVGVAEDGGEMIVGSLMLAYAWSQFGPRAPRPVPSA